MAGEPPSPAKRSFLDILNCSSPNLTVPIKQQSSFRGEPALKFSADEIHILADPLKFALVGKFSHGRPSMAALRKSFAKIDLKGSAQLGLLDHRHILIRVNHDEDFLRLRLRKFWSFDGFLMRVFKWTPEFRTDVESPLVPVWVSFDSLPLFMFNKSSLFSLATIIGAPLKIDSATTDLSRPSVARVCIEIDLRKDLPKRIWLDIGSVGFWQPILYEDLPKYCSSCRKVGHPEAECGLFGSKNSVAAPSLPKPQWVPKNKSSEPMGENAADPIIALEKEPELVTSVKKASTEAPTCEASAALQLVDSPKHTHSPAATSLDARTNIDSAPSQPFKELPIASVINLADSNIATDPILTSENEPAATYASVEMSSASALAVQPNAAATDYFAAASVVDIPLQFRDESVVVSAFEEDSMHAVKPPKSAAVESATIVQNAEAVKLIPPSAPAVGQIAAVVQSCSHASVEYPLVEDSAQVNNLSCDLNPNAPLFIPQVRPTANSSKSFAESGALNKNVPKQSEKSYAAILLGAKEDASPHPVSSKPRFYAIKSAEYPSLPLPNFRILNLSCPFFPQLVDEPSSPRPADAFQVHSDGDAVPRLPTPRPKLSASLRSFHRELNAKLKKGRVPYAFPVIRRKWTKLAPISLPCPASTQNMDSNKASASKDIPLNGSDQYGQPHVDHFDDEVSDDDDSVEYESVWRSSTSDDEAAIEFDTQLALQESLMPMDFNDFSLSPPQHTRRKYTKRFRDLPPPLRTRSAREHFL